MQDNFKDMDQNYESLFKKVNSYIHNEGDLKLIDEAYRFAFFKHHNQFRRSGEAYIIHPVEVSIILADLHVGPHTICAGLLHDVVEDTDTTLADIEEKFGKDVADIVDGVTKINKLSFSSLEKAQVSNHQKMLLAMARDIRIIIVKLADRLHNMRTLDSMPEDKQVRISNETLEIYAPLADKLGMFKIKAELEDRSLRYINPSFYFDIHNKIKKNSNVKNGIINNIINQVKAVLDKSNLKYDIKGRIKNTYSIYKKMINQKKELEDIYDIYAIRIIVDKIETCYQILGLIHAHFTPIPKRFKDYIAVPKSNMYQSLHTTVIGDLGNTFEVQIRTKEMDEIAEYGVAAHWAYKENVQYNKEREQYEIAQKLKWYSDLLTQTKENEESTPEEFVDSIKSDILDANIYVYTPDGDVFELAKGSTPIDFAYKIHTNLGNKTVGAIVNNKIVPLSYELKTGDICNIKTSKSSFGPSEDWLNICKTNHAKHKIKAFLNNQNRDLIIERGKNNLLNELKNQKISFELTDQFVSENFSKNNINTLEELYLEIGKGIFSSKTVAQKIQGGKLDSGELIQKHMERANKILTTNSETGVVVEGLTNPKIKLANCCMPIPGDEIIGYISKGNGIVVHNNICPNCASLVNDRFIKLDWATNLERKYPTRIKIIASDRQNLIAEIMNQVTTLNVQVLSIQASSNQNLETTIKLKILVNNLEGLENLIVNLKKIEGLRNIERDLK
jgi:GTP pyrophosphokinase